MVQEGIIVCPSCRKPARVIDIGDGRGWWITPHIRLRRRHCCGGSSKRISEFSEIKWLHSSTGRASDS